MSNIIKKCPNCGKLMDVDFNKDKVICPNCKKIFLIEHDPIKPDEDNINLVMTVSKKVFVIPILVLLFLILFLIFSFNKLCKSNYLEKNNSEINYSIKSISSLNEEDEKKIFMQSLSLINEWNKLDENVSLTTEKHLGYYLIKLNSVSTLYDVYEMTYKINNNDYNIYTGVEYSSIEKNKQLTFGNSQIHGLSLDKGGKQLWGYDSIKEYYYDIPRTIDSKVEATDGLFK